MSETLNIVRRGFYLDSVALMRLSRDIANLEGVEDAALMMATPANKAIMGAAGVLSAEGEAAGPGDLVIAVRAADGQAASQAREAAETGLDAPKKARTGSAAALYPKSLKKALGEQPDSNIALISVPGDFAASEAKKALRRNLNVMIFSDNVSIEAEIALKQEAQTRNRLVMGPDCGTAIIQGVPLAFANAVARGPIGVVGASGTGIQEVTSLIGRAGSGISHAIGTGGRDLKQEVGGLTTLAAIDLLDNDPATEKIVLISKPPAASVIEKITKRLAASDKPSIFCFLGADTLQLPAGIRQAHTLEEAARLAVDGASFGAKRCEAEAATGRIQGIFAGGTLCAESQIILLRNGCNVASNVPVPGAATSPVDEPICHQLIDLGDDEYTRGRPHPMIDPAIRDEPLLAALQDPEIGIVLIDCVLGTGSHPDPAGAIVDCVKQGPENQPLIIASVTGTDQDSQHAGRSREKLEHAGILVAASNADATELALECLQMQNG